MSLFHFFGGEGARIYLGLSSILKFRGEDSPTRGICPEVWTLYSVNTSKHYVTRRCAAFVCGYVLELSELYASSKLPVGRFEGRGSMRIKSEFEMGDLFSLDVLLEPVSLHRV